MPLNHDPFCRAVGSVDLVSDHSDVPVVLVCAGEPCRLIRKLVQVHLR